MNAIDSGNDLCEACSQVDHLKSWLDCLMMAVGGGCSSGHSGLAHTGQRSKFFARLQEDGEWAVGAPLQQGNSLLD